MNQPLPTVLWVLAGALLVTAGVLTLISGVDDGLLVFASALAVVVLAGILRRRPKPPSDPLDPREFAMLRDQRDRDGEIAAVRALRAHRPEMTLVDAVKLIRES